MQQLALRKGLSLLITGAPDPAIAGAPQPTKLAFLGADYIALKPRLAVEEGDQVLAGKANLADKDMSEVKVVSPVTGRIMAINRGARRKLISVEIQPADDPSASEDFSQVGDVATPEGLTVRLCAAGLWGSFRTRPYSKVPAPGAKPAAIYITAMDTEPVAVDPAPIIAAEAGAFAKGVAAVARLSGGATYLCHQQGVTLPGADLPGVTAAGFSGPRPAGLAGKHMHFLEPPSAQKTVWSIGYADVIAIGLQAGQKSRTTSEWAGRRS